jgi:hypothetical protein
VVILLDVNMPGLNGSRRGHHSQPRHSAHYIIFITADYGSGFTRPWASLGAVDTYRPYCRKCLRRNQGFVDLYLWRGTEAPGGRASRARRGESRPTRRAGSRRLSPSPRQPRVAGSLD